MKFYPNFDLDKSSFCAFLSSLAYAPKGVIQDTAKRLNFNYVDINGEGFFFIKGSFSYISFKGTNNPKDFIIDSEFVKVSRYYGRVHNGFVDRFETVKNLITKIVQDNNIKEVTVTGHSLGAALASLSSFYLEDKKIAKVIDVYTYGQPRIGNWRWRRNYNNLIKNHFRFVNDQDIVTKIPRLFYLHIGKPIYINKSEFTVKNPQGWRRFFIIPLIKGINDHKIFRRYFIKICAYLDKPFMEGSLVDICRILKKL